MDLTATKTALQPLIKKTPLEERLLQRPPFRYLRDLTLEVIRRSGFMLDDFTAEELEQFANNSDVTKQEKLDYLQRLLDNLTRATGGEPIDVMPAKIVAGLEPEKTNRFLQLFAQTAQQYATNNKGDMTNPSANGNINGHQNGAANGGYSDQTVTLKTATKNPPRAAPTGPTKPAISSTRKKEDVRSNRTTANTTTATPVSKSVSKPNSAASAAKQPTASGGKKSIASASKTASSTITKPAAATQPQKEETVTVNAVAKRTVPASTAAANMLDDRGGSKSGRGGSGKSESSTDFTSSAFDRSTPSPVLNPPPLAHATTANAEPPRRRSVADEPTQPSPNVEQLPLPTSPQATTGNELSETPANVRRASQSSTEHTLFNVPSSAGAINGMPEPSAHTVSQSHNIRPMSRAARPGTAHKPLPPARKRPEPRVVSTATASNIDSNNDTSTKMNRDADNAGSNSGIISETTNDAAATADKLKASNFLSDANNANNADDESFYDVVEAKPGVDSGHLFDTESRQGNEHQLASSGGILINKLVTTKDEYEQQQQSKTQTETDAKLASGGKWLKNVEQLSSELQQSTGHVAEVAQLLDYLHEDEEAMRAEYKSWHEEATGLQAKVAQYEQSMRSSFEPLLRELAALDSAINVERAHVDEKRSRLLANDNLMANVLRDSATSQRG